MPVPPAAQAAGGESPIKGKLEQAAMAYGRPQVPQLTGQQGQGD